MLINLENTWFKIRSKSNYIVLIYKYYKIPAMLWVSDKIYLSLNMFDIRVSRFYKPKYLNSIIIFWILKPFTYNMSMQIFSITKYIGTYNIYFMLLVLLNIITNKLLLIRFCSKFTFFSIYSIFNNFHLVYKKWFCFLK